MGNRCWGGVTLWAEISCHAAGILQKGRGDVFAIFAPREGTRDEFPANSRSLEVAGTDSFASFPTIDWER